MHGRKGGTNGSTGRYRPTETVTQWDIKARTREMYFFCMELPHYWKLLTRGWRLQSFRGGGQGQKCTILAIQGPGRKCAIRKLRASDGRTDGRTGQRTNGRIKDWTDTPTANIVKMLEDSHRKEATSSILKWRSIGAIDSESEYRHSGGSKDVKKPDAMHKNISLSEIEAY